MASKSFDFSVTPEIDSRSTFRFIDKMDDKFRHLKRALVYATAHQAYQKVMSRVPSTSEYDEMRKGLRFNEVTSQPDSPAFMISIPSKGKRIRTIDQPKTVIYVRVKRTRIDRADPKVKYLEDNGPWTSDTIPFWPSTKMAVVIQRKVSKREASQIAAMQMKAAPKVRRELAAMGSRSARGPASQQPGRKKAISDVAYAATQLEFGGGETRPVPIWRVSLLEIARSKPERLLKGYPQAMQMIKNPGSTASMKWPKPMRKIKLDEARGYKPFMKRLGVR